MNDINIYCIAEKIDKIKTTGINSKPVKITYYDKLCMVYSLMDEKVSFTEENFLAHENVLEELLIKDITLLPFRFGTCINEEMGKRVLEENYNTFLEHIKGLKGKVEMSIRALWDYAKVFKKVTDGFTVPKVNVPNEKVKDYLNKKMKDYKIEGRIREYAAEEAEKIHKSFTGDDFEGKYTLMKTDAMFFNASYLLKKDKMNVFYSRFQQITPNYDEYRFLITGPWPPYNFCNISI